MPDAPSAPPPTAPLADEPPRVIGPVAGFAIVAGSMLGVGIFLFPGQVAEQIPSLLAFFALWIVGGLFALAGSVACGELGAMLPRAGGDYAFQREAFGPSTAFASGWVLFGAIFAGSVAAMSVAVFQYQVGTLLGADLTEDLAGLPFSAAQLGAVGLILVLTLLNDAGTHVSARAQILLTLLPIGALLALAVVGLTTGASSAPVAKPGADTLTIGGLAAGFLLVNFTFSGWINIIYVAGEVKDPGKNIPRSMISATVGITGLYLLLCVAFIVVLGFGGLASLGWTDAGTGMAQVIGSDVLGTIVLLIIAVAIVTSVNATILSSARVAYAMAKDGAFWNGAAKLSGKNRVPRRALWLQAVLAAVIVLSGTFDAIVKMTSIAMFVTGTLTVLSMFVLRRTQPALPRPYRATLYPWLPALYVLLSVAAIAATVWDATRTTGSDAWFPLIGVGVLIVAFAGHLVYVRKTAAAAGVIGAAALTGVALHKISEWTLS